MREKIYIFLMLIHPFITLLMGYYAYKYLWVAPYGRDTYSIIFGSITLALFVRGVFRMYEMYKDMFNSKKQDTYNYVKPMLKAAKALLKDDYHNFKKQIMPSVKNKDFYFVDDQGRKYHTEYIEEDDYEKLNQRYIKMALLKDIKIIKRDGKYVKEYVPINGVWDSLERYLFVYAKENSYITQIDNNDFLEKLKMLTSRYKIALNLDFLSKLENEDRDSNEKYSLAHKGLCYTSEVWSKEKIEAYLKVASLLEEKGYIFFLIYNGSDNRYFSIVPKKLFPTLENLKEIEVITIKELLTAHIGERHYTYKEQFEMFYKEVESKITQSEYETIYIISNSNTARESLSQIAGVGIGVDDESYPMYDDTPMQHVCTLDTKDFPNLAQRYPNTRAISLYISDFEDNEAYEIDIGETKVIFLTQEDIETKKLNKSVPVGMDSLSMHIEPCKIPKGLLSKDILDYEEGSWEYKLYSFIYNFNYAGGSATWVQSGWGLDASDGFIAQFDESLFGSASKINFASGIMYLFENRAFWEC